MQREPTSQIDQHGWHEARFSRAKEKSSCIELAGGLNETRQGCHHSPRNQDSREPFLRAPSVRNDRARYLKQDVAEVERSHAEGVDPIAEAEVTAHPEIGEGNVDAIDVRDNVEQEGKR